MPYTIGQHMPGCAPIEGTHYATDFESARQKLLEGLDLFEQDEDSEDEMYEEAAARWHIAMDEVRAMTGPGEIYVNGWIFWIKEV